MTRLAKNTIKVVYSDQSLPTETTKSIFLAGPTPRDGNVDTWRNEATEILKSLNYDGIVFVPESSTGEYKHSYDDQIEWELAALNRADIIVFWIPRELKHFPAFTTNVEFGSWITSGKVTFGFPPKAEKMRYLESLATLNNVKTHSTLKDTLQEAVERIGEGAHRVDGEVEVPLYIWKIPTFQNWYEAQTNAGNVLEHAKLLFNARVGPKKDKVFFWVLLVDIFVASENRNKTIEFVASRSDNTAVVLYKKVDNVMDTEIILVKEFRSPAATFDAYVWELPGGSSVDEKDNQLTVISNEIEEELGFKLDINRLQLIKRRQVNETLLANKVTLFSAEITDDELNWFKSQKGIVKGNIQDTERTFTEVLTLGEILEQEHVDWLNIGMIMTVVNTFGKEDKDE